ncbi:Ubiquitin conjugation factor E4 A [Amphibalanus amphitrite]|uniref:Ubiquitin conjugation factor E4 A n=1 Tax=Amphibalanus amphitrite TaxID=1232801 RepID=A0A6A4W2Z3_AMPAM|nr:Ubiquitin conjugation factor E4 A [Amphibalanus amphitrite]
MSEQDQQPRDRAAAELPAKSACSSGPAPDRSTLLLERLFGVTGRRLAAAGSGPAPLLLPELTASGAPLSLDTLQEAVFERLMVTDRPADEGDAWTYLVRCSGRVAAETSTQLPDEQRAAVRELIVQNGSTVLQQPDIFGMENRRSFFESLRAHLAIDGWFDDFLRAVVLRLVEEEAPLRDIFQETFQYIQRVVGETKGSLMNMDRFVYSLATFMSTMAPLAETLVSLSEVPDTLSLGGVLYCRVPLGSLLWPSALNPVGEFFDQPVTLTQQSVDVVNSSIWTSERFIAETVHKVFENILRCGGRARQLLLRWIAACLRANAGRAKIWHTDMDGSGGHMAPDGFMLNLGSVLLRLSLPFVRDLDSPKLLEVDPTYCAAPMPTSEEQQAARWQHLADLDKETCLVPRPEDAPPPAPGKFNFRTECFYLCHKTLQLGLKVLQDKLSKLNGELGRMQRVYRDALTQAAGQDAELEGIKGRFEGLMQRYLCLKAALTEPSRTEHASQFLTATAVWLTQQAARPADDEPLRSRRELTFPLPSPVHPSLSCIPEMLADNLTSHLLAVGRFTPEQWSVAPDACRHMFSFILVFMGSTERMRNPHLRAQLAACLEVLLPDFGEEHGHGLLSAGYQRQQLFLSHELADQVVPALLHVFVSIEMTGQSVQFEEKFNYRRPMYVIMKYLWSVDRHRNMFFSLSESAERDMDSATPPIFLRFINLLMNDAVFLLDEALSYMTQLRDQLQHRQTEEYSALTTSPSHVQVQHRQTEEYSALPAQQRHQQEANFRHMGMLARFHNIMARETISALEMLTSGIRSIFLQPAIVDRVVAMLNYFLLQLVGPKRRELKVRDTSDDYDFKPGELVTGICKIYTQLECEQFCAAVAADERSYSPQLFTDAIQVLARIGQGQLIPAVESVAAQVAGSGAALKAEEDLAAQAPDHFLDPIISSLMADPVRLPTSGIICDRSTIARHLLSDQSDPFNRKPLTMEQVEPAAELKAEIEEWRRQKLAERSAGDR